MEQNAVDRLIRVHVQVSHYSIISLISAVAGSSCLGPSWPVAEELVPAGHLQSPRGLKSSPSGLTSSCRRLFKSNSAAEVWTMLYAEMSRPALLHSFSTHTKVSHFPVRAGSSTGKCSSSTKATFSRVQLLIVSASSADHTLIIHMTSAGRFPISVANKTSLSGAFLGQSIRAAVFCLRVTTCWQNQNNLDEATGENLLGGLPAACSVSAVLRVFPFQWKRKPEIFQLFKSLVYPWQMRAGTPHSWVSYFLMRSMMASTYTSSSAHRTTNTEVPGVTVVFVNIRKIMK